MKFSGYTGSSGSTLVANAPMLVCLEYILLELYPILEKWQYYLVMPEWRPMIA